MDIKAEDFPLYQLLVQLNEPGIERAKADFAKAQTGGDEEKYQFAFGIQTVAANVPVGAIPGFTAEMRDKTLQSCLAVFNEAAGSGHANAAYMVQDFKSRGLGQPAKKANRFSL